MTLSSGVERPVSFQTSRASVPLHNLPLVAHQILEQLELPDGQVDSLSSTRHLPAEEIHREIAHGELGSLAEPWTAEQRADARQHLLECERFDEIVVGATIEPEDAILERIACR